MVTPTGKESAIPTRNREGSPRQGYRRCTTGHPPASLQKSRTRFHIRRRRKPGTSKHYVYTTPSKKAVQAIKDKVKAKTYRSTRHLSLDELLTSLNRVLRGWANYFRYAVSKDVFNAIDSLAWGRIMRWIRAKYKSGRNPIGMRELRRRFCDKGWRFAHNGVVFTGASIVMVTRYRYRGNKIATPWTPKPATANCG